MGSPGFPAPPCSVWPLFLPQYRADDLRNQHRRRVDAIDIPVAVIIVVTGLEAVLRAHIVRDLVVVPGVAVAQRPALADIVQLLGLARWQAAIVLLGQAGRAAARAVTNITVGPMALGMIRLSIRRGGRSERRDARKDHQMFHVRHNAPTGLNGP